MGRSSNEKTNVKINLIAVKKKRHEFADTLRCKVKITKRVA